MNEKGSSARARALDTREREGEREKGGWKLI